MAGAIKQIQLVDAYWDLKCTLTSLIPIGIAEKATSTFQTLDNSFNGYLLTGCGAMFTRYEEVPLTFKWDFLLQIETGLTFARVPTCRGTEVLAIPSVSCFWPN
jgi:hypothetical protein